MLLNCVGRVVFAEYLFLKCKAIFSEKDVENTVFKNKCYIIREIQNEK